MPKPFTPDQIRLAANRVVEAQRLRRRLAELQQELDETGEPPFFESRSPVFLRFLQTTARAAASDAVLLLCGESGTGKNVLARWIRANSPRADAPFITVNCPALSAELMTSALFGHRRGAFTGAVADVAGKVRLIAATNRDLEAEVRAGRFREDLFYRLHVLALTLPALRDRPEDTLPLARHYLSTFARKRRRQALSFSAATEDAIRTHVWPGNLRELRNAVERAVILALHDVLEPSDLGLSDTPILAAAGINQAARVGAPVSLDLLEREHIASVIAQAPSLEAAARILDIDATTLQRKRKRYGLA